jgi:hypothetical protein
MALMLKVCSTRVRNQTHAHAEAEAIIPRPTTIGSLAQKDRHCVAVIAKNCKRGKSNNLSIL